MTVQEGGTKWDRYLAFLYPLADENCSLDDKQNAIPHQKDSNIIDECDHDIEKR